MAMPKEPRQKMINIMYLVLTALLALNVAAEILNAFRTVNTSLQTASKTIDTKNQTLFESFKQLANKAETRERAQQWQPLALKAKQMADEVNKFIEDTKMELMVRNGWTPEHRTFEEDNLEKTTNYMTDPGTRGDELLKVLTKFKNDLLNIHPAIKAKYATSLPLNLNIPETNNTAHKDDWAASYFYMTPAIAAITILSKFQNDVKNSEAMVVEYCHQQVGAVEQVFNAYEPLVGQSSNYLMPGQELTITAGIGAYNTQSRPTITIDGAQMSLNANGIAEYKTTVGGTGSYTKRIRISFFNQATGKQETVEHPVEYTVGSPTGVTVSADAVKVLYVSLDNPISITGGVKGAESIQASISQGTLTNQGSGKYIARVSTPGRATITVRSSDGKVTTSEFRVKTIPPPVPKVGRLGGGRMPVNEFKAQQGVRADMQDFVFEGVKYDVVSFLLIGTGKGFEATGPQVADNNGAYFGSDARRIIEMCKNGSTVIIDRIKVSGPDGTKLLPGNAAFNLY